VRRPSRILGRILLAILLLAGSVLPCPAATERILSFDSNVEIAPDGKLTVTETIRVLATGAAIRHGIVREFPTSYRTSDGQTVTVDFRVRFVRQDGSAASYHITNASNGKNIYIGDKDTLVRPGEHTYTLTYGTDGQVGQFAGHDELYWNVTGNGWRFPIDLATATIRLPPGAPLEKSTAYTGRTGARGTDFRLDPGQNSLSVRTTRPLAPGEGLTVVAAWPKGFVTLPTPLERAVRSQAFPVAVAGLVAVFVYFMIAWVLVGRDPKAGTRIPLFTPPPGMSAPEARYVWRMGFDDKTFAAALVDLAVAGGVRIEEASGIFTMARGGANFPKDAWQQRVRAKLLGSAASVQLKQDNHTAIAAARKVLRQNLADRYQGSHFRTNLGYFIVGALFSVLVMAVAAYRSEDPATTAGFLTWVGIWSCGVVLLAVKAFNALRAARHRPGLRTLFGALFACLFALPFFIGEIVGLAFLGLALSLPATACLAVMAGLNAWFWYLLKAPTAEGRRVLDGLEGFRMYLAIGERERLELLHPPERTPALFEKYLPFAMALNVETAWAAQFDDVLRQAALEGYTPTWYLGDAWRGEHFGSFADNLGSGFSSAIAASATAPGSSSGFGGGGGSGGGGGGGGGGGW